MLKLEIFIIELRAIDRLSSGTISCCEITTLDHELLDNSVEGGSLIREENARFAIAFLAGAECAEVFCGLGHDVVVQLEADSSFGFLAD